MNVNTETSPLEEPQWLKEAPAVARPRTSDETEFLMDAPRLIEGEELVDLNLEVFRMVSACGDATTAIDRKVKDGCVNIMQAKRLLAAHDHLVHLGRAIDGLFSILYDSEDDCPF